METCLACSQCKRDGEGACSLSRQWFDGVLNERSEFLARPRPGTDHNISESKRHCSVRAVAQSSENKIRMRQAGQRKHKNVSLCKQLHQCMMRAPILKLLSVNDYFWRCGSYGKLRTFLQSSETAIREDTDEAQIDVSNLLHNLYPASLGKMFIMVIFTLVLPMLWCPG